MSKLINGRTPEEIKARQEACATYASCSVCPYESDETCDVFEVLENARALIERLESERDAALEKVPKWINVEERLPENEECVLITAQHDGYFGKPWSIVMTAFHTNGKTLAGDSVYNWTEGSIEMEYDEKTDDFIVPEGWWEDVQCGDEFQKVEAKVTRWMQLPKLPKEV